MSEVDKELQSFIADCEWKTRKILRDSNRRRKDGARCLSAKERVERLKRKGSISTKANAPLTKSKSLNRSILSSTKKIPTTPVKVWKRRDGAATKKTPTTSAKEWKRRDEIIHDACETIKSLPMEKNSSLQAVVRKESRRAEEVRAGVHSSLSKSPFCGSNGNADKSKQGSSATGPEGPGKGEPAAITRRTIERDFYMMAKKRGNPPSKRRQRPKVSEEPPALETSILRKKYRCDERAMRVKKKRAEREYEKLKRLKPPDDESDGLPNTVGESDDSDSSVSSEEEDHFHALHDLVERHVEDENIRSLKRSDKMLANLIFEPDVESFWAHLRRDLGGLAESESEGASKGQVPSVPLCVATKAFDNSSLAQTIVDMHDGARQYTPGADQIPVSRRVSIYAKPNFAQMRLAVDEPLAAPFSNQKVPLTATVSIARVDDTNNLDSSTANVWTYDIYDPCNGTARVFALSEESFDSLTNEMRPPLHNRRDRKPVQKIVHRQTESNDGTESTFVVRVSANIDGITSKVYRVGGNTADERDSLCVEENLIANLRACEVLQLLKKHHLHSAWDKEFWLGQFNGASIWQPLVETVRDRAAAPGCACPSENFWMGATIKAHDSLFALKANMDRAEEGDMDRLYAMIQHRAIKRDELLMESKSEVPLSIRISGCSVYSNTICPGHSPIGERGAWRFSEPVIDEKNDSMFPIWPSLMDIKHPKAMDKSQASAFFHRKALGPQKGDCIAVLNALAFESPILAPYCYAIDRGYISPPFSEHELPTGIIPYVHLPCTSLLETPVLSRLDTLLPPPVIVLDPGASEEDWKDAPTNADGNVFHSRESSECDDDGFRIRTFARRVEYDDTILSTVYGISEKAASHNIPATSPFLTHTSRETCTRHLSRERTAADYRYIAKSDGEGTLGEPYLFATHMSAYKSVFVSRKSVSSHREQERFLHATKEAERKRLDLALKMKAAEELVEERLKERIARIESSVKAKEDLAENCDDSVAVELSLSIEESMPPIQEKTPCEVELPVPLNELLDDDANDNNELEQLANLLLKNTNFLKAVARKLSVSEDQVMQIDSSIGNDNAMDPGIHNKDDHDDFPGQRTEKSTIHQTLAATFPSKLGAKGMPKLMLNCKKYRDNDHTSSRGDGWKRLPRSETIIGEFSLTKRNTERGTGGPKFKKLEGDRNFIAVNAVHELPYEIDSQQFAPEPKSLFVPDLTTERLRLAKTYRQNKKAKESILSASQQQSLDEILQIPVSSANERSPEETKEEAEADVIDGVSLENETRPVDQVARAILAVKNHNLPELELVLDTEGLSVETRDYHGNTLFILACQQGSKKQAKFLLRRGADMNAQNNGGNTALHYLYEYKHISLADYLIRKGANDGIKNGNSNTCYEGLDADIL